MLIDWFTVIAQIVNFLVLIWLLKFFLYDRIIKAMDKREAEIAERLENARREREEAEQEKRDYEDKKAELERSRREVLSRTEKEAESRRKELLDKAESEAEEKRRRWRESLASEKRELARSFRRLLVDRVHEVLVRGAALVAGADLEERAAERFLDKLSGLDADDRSRLAEAARESGEVRVASARELPSDARRKLTLALHEMLGKDVEVAYEEDNDLLIGLEAVSGSRRVAWHMKDYLGRVEEKVSDFVAKAAGTPGEGGEASDGA